jgi:Flp pilus assembly protein TadD
VLIHAGKDSGDAKQYEEALHAFSSAQEVQPRFADNLHDWGEALLSNGELDEAVRKFSLAVSISGDRHGPSRIGWGIAHYCKGDVTGARLELDRARGLNGNDDDVARVLAAMSNDLRTNVPRAIVPVADTAAAARGDGSTQPTAYYRQCAQGMLRAKELSASNFQS